MKSAKISLVSRSMMLMLGRLVVVVVGWFMVPNVALAYEWSSTLFTDNIHSMLFLAQTISLFLGVCLFLASIFQFKKVMEARAMMGQRPLTGPILTMLASVGLLALPTMMGTMVNMIFGTTSLLSYEGASGGAPGTDGTMEALILLLRFLGAVSVIRGFIALSRAGKENAQPGQIGKAVMFMVGGALLINIVGTYSLVKNAIGFLS